MCIVQRDQLSERLTEKPGDVLEVFELPRRGAGEAAMSLRVGDAERFDEPGGLALLAQAMAFQERTDASHAQGPDVPARRCNARLSRHSRYP